MNRRAGQVPPNALRVAPLAGPETLASSSPTMSALGHEQTSRHARVMSALPLKADIRQREVHVPYVSLADVGGPP
jgi:hypothetical protein